MPAVWGGWLGDVSAETEAFQAYLEGVRAHPDDAELATDLDRARAAMERAWLEHTPVREKP